MMLLRTILDNWAAMAFIRNLNENDLEATRRLTNCLWEFSDKTWNDVYHRYIMKLRIEEDISTLPVLGNRETKRYIHWPKMIWKQEDLRHRDSKVYYKPYLGLLRQENNWRHRINHKYRGPKRRNNVVPHRARRIRSTKNQLLSPLAKTSWL